MRRQRTRPRVEVVCLLPHLAARLPDLDLARDLRVDPARDEGEGVHVLELGTRPELARAGRANGDVGIDAQRPLLHLGVRDPELDDRLAEKLQEPLRLLRGVDVGRRDDLDERCASAVEVDERVVGSSDPPGASTHVHGLRRILLEVRTDDPDHVIAFGGWY